MRWLIVVILLLFLSLPIVTAVDLNDSLSDEDKAQFNEILKPVHKIYNFVKYIASVIGALMLVFAGITYMTSGGDPKKRDQAKSMATYVIIGLLIIWAAPLIINLLI